MRNCNFSDLINEDRIMAEFFELVQIDSETRNERAMADRLKVKLTSLGFDVTEDNAGDRIGGNAGNLIGRLPGTAGGPVVMLSAHMDRVPPGNGVKPAIDGDTVRSDGTTILAADDVVGLTGILEAIRVLKENDIAYPPVVVVFTIAEEGGLNGAKGLDKTSAKADMGFFLDAGGDVGTLVIAAPYQSKFEVTVRGVAAHAGINPEAGVNAIMVAAEALSKLTIGRIDHETTSNIGTFRAGHATNVVPDKAFITAEARSHSREKLKAQLDRMTESFEKAALKYGAKADIHIEESYGGFRLDPESQAVKLASEAVRSLGLEPSLKSTNGGSDANIMNEAGIPSVVLGVGFEKVHSTGERIKIDQILKTAALTASILHKAAEA